MEPWVALLIPPNIVMARLQQLESKDLLLQAVANFPNLDGMMRIINTTYPCQETHACTGWNKAYVIKINNDDKAIEAIKEFISLWINK